MRIALLGPPGAGKGSLASLYKQRLGLAHISTGDIFRQEVDRRSALGRRVQRFVTRGKLVPDRLVVQVMRKRLSRSRRSGGFMLDGFPRTVGQARGLDVVMRRMGCPLNGAIYLAASQSVLVRRLAGRRVCARCGANYHIRTMRPTRAGRCDRCQGVLIIRDDDRSATIKKRLAIDRVEATPLLRYYEKQGKLRRVNGAGALEGVFARTLALCRLEGWLDAPRKPKAVQSDRLQATSRRPQDTSQHYKGG